MTEVPPTQAQDHDRRIGRLEGMAEQFVEQGRQTNTRLDRIEQAIAAQGRELRQEIDVQGRELQQKIDVQGRELRQKIDKQFCWLLGIQITSLIALGTLILSRLP